MVVPFPSSARPRMIPSDIVTFRQVRAVQTVSGVNRMPAAQSTSLLPPCQVAAEGGQGNDGQVAGSAGEVQMIGHHTLEGGGCSCAVPANRGNGSTWWFAIGAALLFWRRRKAV
jgi:MYXO-CTERM domain-containing protein